MIFPKTLTAFLLAPAALQALAADPQIHVALETPEKVENVNGATVTAKVTNKGSEDVTIVNDPSSFASTWKTNSFAIKNGDGKEAKFAGFLVKSDLARVSRTTIPAGQTVEVEHVLAGAYNFASAGAGQFSVEAVSNVLHIVDAAGALQPIEAVVDTTNTLFDLLDVTTEVTEELASVAKSGVDAVVSLARVVTGGLLPLDRRDGMEIRAKSPKMESCDAKQKEQLNKAVPAAQGYLTDALSVLSNDTAAATSARYSTWFGKFDAKLHKEVVNTFTKVSKQDWNSFTFTCDCQDDGVWAFVEPDTFGTINLCGEYWKHKTERVQDSQAGTLIHESTHFTKNGATDDIVYQPSGVKNLAQQHPTQAPHNADSFEYFCESRDPGVVKKDE